MENHSGYISFGKLGQFHPTTVMACFSLLYVAAWSSVTLILFGHTLFMWDTMTGLMWGQDWLLLPPNYLPPLPNWLLYIFFQLGAWGTAIISPLSQALCLFMVYLFARRFVEPHKALLSAALLLGLYFFRTSEVIRYNHDTAQPIFWILVIYLFHVCLRGKGLHYWCFLGAAAAACFLSKYTAVFLLICVPIWLLIDPEARKLLWTLGPYISLLIFLLLVSPHLTYFYLYDGSIRNPYYANLGAVDIILSCVGKHSWMFIILALTGFLWKGAFSWSRPLTRDDRFLLVFALLPFLLVFAAGSIIDQQYISLWFWPFFTLSGLLMMRFLGGRATLQRCHWGIYACIALLIIAPGVALTQDIYRTKMAYNDGIFPVKKRAFLSSPDLAYKADAILAQHTTYDPHQHRIVIAKGAFAGAFFMMKSPQIKLFYHADTRWSPAIDQKALCDSTLIMLPKQNSQDILSMKIENIKHRYHSRIKRVILDCMAQGVQPITFDILVRYRRRLFAQRPHPPREIQFILLKK